MKRTIKILITALQMVSAINTSGQTYEPTILILSPYKTTSDAQLEKEIDEINGEIEANRKEWEKEIDNARKELENRPENIKLIFNKQVEFIKAMDFSTKISSVAEGFLQYRFFERFENLLIYATKEKSNGSIEQLTTIADKNNMQYIVNFPEVTSFIENNIKRTTIRVQLFNNHQKLIVLDKEFTGQDGNPGLEFACKSGSLSCTINNSLSQALDEIIAIVATNSPTIIRERELANKRADVLFSKYYLQEPAKEIPGIIEKTDTSISTAGFYHGFMDDKETKFIGFFAVSSKAANFQEMQDKNDMHVHIISDDMYDLDNIPKIYANVVVGIKYNSKWYIKRDKVTYFNAEDFETGKKEFFLNLQNWNFFTENSTENNPDFWETYFFDKVKDVTQEPDYEEYYESIYKKQERKNKGFVGMYEIVADKIRAEQAASREEFKKSLDERVIRPFLEKQKSEKPNEFADYSLVNQKVTLIFPKDRSVVLNPIQIINSQDQRKIRYFVLFPDANEIYEWTYLKPQILESKNWHYGSEIIEQLSTIAEWNFSFDTLDDKNFWENFVLLREGNNYKFLRRIE